MTEAAAIVIVGGGVVGSSIAYHLARRGAGSGVVVLERERIGSGSTSASGGGIRSQFSTEINLRFSLESVRFWRRFEEEMGASADYQQTGYLFLAQAAEAREQMRRNVALQNKFGIASRFLEPADVAQMMPELRTDDLIGATYFSEDGMAGPNEATQAFARRARDGGVRIREGVEVTAVETDRGRVAAISTSEGRIETPVIVNAAGAWSGLIGKMAGVEVPVLPYRRTIFISEPFTGLPERFPFVIDLHAGWAIKREGKTGLYMTGTKDAHSSFNREVDWDGLAVVGEIATHRLPVLAEARFGKKAYAGLYEVSPDNHAILGAVPDLQGFYLATGFSGHGFQHSPATGRLMADLLLDGRTDLDIAPLNVDRFRTGSLLHEPLNAHSGTMSG